MRPQLLRSLRQSAAAAAPRGVRGLSASAGSSYDAVIVGSGVIGASCALELRKLGFRTLNVDGNPSPGYGSTSSSSAIVRHFYSLEDTARLAWEGYHCWKNWAEHVEAAPGEELCHLHEVGCAAIDTPNNPQCQTYIANVKKAMEVCNIPVEYWDEPELRKRLPYFSTDSYFPPRRVDDEEFGEGNGRTLSGLLFCAQAGYVNDPQLAARNLADAAARRGAEFRWGSRVVEILKDAQGLKVEGVKLDDGSVLHANVVVNVAGPHSSALHRLAFQGAGVADDSKLHSRPLRVEVAYLNEPPGSNVDETLPMIADLDVGIYLRPQKGGTILVGSVEPECDPLHFFDDADELQDGLSEEWTNYAYRAALRMPTLQVPNSATGLVAMYDTTPDWVPIYDKTALGGFYAMCGTSGNQFKTAPVVGRLCAQLVERGQNGLDQDREPLQLEMRHAEGTVDSSIFSRLRAQKATSGTVMG